MVNTRPKLQQKIFQAANIDYGRFRTAYKELKQYYQEHPEKLERILKI